MEVLSFLSQDKLVSISVNTSSDMAHCWRRFHSRVKEKAETYCDYRSSIAGELRICLPSERFELGRIGDENQKEWLGFPPVIYETANYTISLYFSNLAEKPRVIHKMKEITDLFTAIDLGGGKWFVSAPLSFVNEPGIFELSYKYKEIGRPEQIESFSFRVVSPKLDTKDDYNHLLADINAEYNEIVYQYLTLTLQNLECGGKSSNDIIWLSIFRNIAKEYEKWVRYILYKPHLKHKKEIFYDKADRIKRWTPKMTEQFALVRSKGRLEKEYFRHEEIENTHNTRENRFVKFTLLSIGKRLVKIVDEIKTRNLKAKAKDQVAQSELEELDGYVKSIEKLKNTSLFRNLKPEPLQAQSMVLQKRSGYAQIYRYWLLLKRGIELFEGSNAIGVRPIWELYELWCFLKIRKMIADILKLDFSNPNEIQEDPMPMLKPFEDNTQQHIVTYTLKNGMKVKLLYQHKYMRNNESAHTATTVNIPDIVMTIAKTDDLELTYIFDAKYRLIDDNKLNDEDKIEIKDLDGADTPPYDALNQMHRYRDAIYYGKGKQEHTSKEIIGGYILFPGRGKKESVKERFFYKSIKSVNIGAFPLLPDASDPNNEGSLLYDFLEEVLTATTSYELIKDAIPQKGLKYEDETIPNNKDLVLVGYYKTSELAAIMNSQYYFVPTALGNGSINLVSGCEKTRYLLLHHKKEKRYMLALDGKGPQFFPRSVVAEKGFEANNDFYLGFKIKSITEVKGMEEYRDNYKLERFRSQETTPYFTTFDKIKGENK